MVSGISSPQATPYGQAIAPAGSAAAGDTNASGATLVAANAHNEASGNLSIVTKEGDTVTISAHLEADATYASMRSRGASASYLSLESSSSLDIQVQGNLSDQEMQDIQKLVKQFSRELRQFFKGSEGADATDVGKGNFSSLTGFAVHFDASQSLTITAAVLPPSQPVTGGTDPSGSPGNPAGALDDGDGDNDANEVRGDASPPMSFSGHEVSDLIGKLLKAASQSGLPQRKLNELVGDLFDKAAKSLEGNKPAEVLDHLRRELEHGVKRADQHEGSRHEAQDPEPSQDFAVPTA